MVNVDKLAGKFRENKKSQKQMAEVVGISETSLSKKMTGKVSFSVDEARTIAAELRLSGQEIMDIFFSDRVA